MEPAGTERGGGPLLVTMDVWHPDCWVLETTATVDVGLLSYGCFPRENGRATTLFTLYADTAGAIDRGIDVIRAAPAVYDVAEMREDRRTARPARPGNATRELLVDQDGTTQISETFTDRGLVPAEPVDARNDREHWTVLTHLDRDRLTAVLDEVRRIENAEITVTSVTAADRTEKPGPLPLDRLSGRQREVFRLARGRGYYARPRRTDAGELAEELGITRSTLHEHLRKVEARLLDGDASHGDRS